MITCPNALSDSAHPAPIPDQEAADGVFATPVEQALAAARRRAADRRARRTGGRPTVDPSPQPPASRAAAWAAARRQLIHCKACGRCEPRPPDDLQRLAQGRWPECCGAVMAPVWEPGADENPSAIPFAEPAPERRAGDRRPPRPGTRVEVRRGQLGMGPDLALALLDVSEAGARIHLKAPVRPGDQVEVALWPPGGARSVRGPARVIWCRGDASGGVQIGVRLRRRLVPQDLFELAE